MVYFMCKFHRTATSSSSAGSTTWTFEPLTMPKISLAVVPLHSELDISPLLWQHTVTRTAHTVGQEKRVMVGMLAGPLLPISPSSIFTFLLSHDHPEHCVWRKIEMERARQPTTRGRWREDRVNERKESQRREKKKGGLSRRSGRQFCEPVTH